MFQEALDFLEEKLETLLSKWKEMPLNCLEKDIIALIDALGNAGCLDSMDSLNVVWSDKTLPAEIRIAAIRANRLMIELSAMQVCITGSLVGGFLNNSHKTHCSKFLHV